MDQITGGNLEEMFEKIKSNLDVVPYCNTCQKEVPGGEELHHFMQNHQLTIKKRNNG